MKTLRGHLQDKLGSQRFRKLYDEEAQLARLAVQVQEVRQELGLSQEDVAKRANVTQQQLSKVENGANCNVTTLLKVCRALGLRVELEPLKQTESQVAKA